MAVMFYRKQALQKQKEYLKKRKQKKVARVHELEAEREKSKKSWLNFSVRKQMHSCYFNGMFDYFGM